MWRFKWKKIIVFTVILFLCFLTPDKVSADPVGCATGCQHQSNGWNPCAQGSGCVGGGGYTCSDGGIGKVFEQQVYSNGMCSQEDWVGEGCVGCGGGACQGSLAGLVTGIPNGYDLNQLYVHVQGGTSSKPLNLNYPVQVGTTPWGVSGYYWTTGTVEMAIGANYVADARSYAPGNTVNPASYSVTGLQCGGKSDLNFSYNIVTNTCPATISVSGRLRGLPSGAFPTVCTGPNATGTCATTSAISGSSDRNYTIIVNNNSSSTFYPTGVGWMSITPSTRVENVTCSNVSGQDFTYAACSTPVDPTNLMPSGNLSFWPTTFNWTKSASSWTDQYTYALHDNTADPGWNNWGCAAGYGYASNVYKTSATYCVRLGNVSSSTQGLTLIAGHDYQWGAYAGSCANPFNQPGTAWSPMNVSTSWKHFTCVDLTNINPTNVFPANNAVMSPTSYQATWNANTAYASSWLFRFHDSTPNYSTDVSTGWSCANPMPGDFCESTISPTHPLGTLKPGHTYHMWVHNANGCTANSNPGTGVNFCVPPGTPNGISPPSGTYDVSMVPGTITWSVDNPEGVEKYLIQVFDTTSGSPVSIYGPATVDAPALSYTPAPSISYQRNHTYQISVTARNTPCGVGTAGTTTISILPPSYFQVLGGGVGSVGSIKNPNLISTKYFSDLSQGGAIDAGVISGKTGTALSSFSSANYGTGSFLSHQGNAPGWNLADYDNAPISQTYDTFLQVVLKNAGYPSNPCTSATYGSKGTLGRFHLYCFGPNGPNSLDNILANANTGSTELMLDGVTPIIQLLLPDTTFGINQPETLTLKTISSRPIIFFTDGPLTISGNIAVTQSSLNTALVGVVRGDINVTNTTNPSILDGTYIFGSDTGGTFSTGVSVNPLKGFGLWMAMGTAGFNLGRTTSGAAGETVTYDPRYLILFKKVLSNAKYTWKELPPQ